MYASVCVMMHDVVCVCVCVCVYPLLWAHGYGVLLDDLAHGMFEVLLRRTALQVLIVQRPALLHTPIRHTHTHTHTHCISDTRASTWWIDCVRCRMVW